MMEAFSCDGRPLQRHSKLNSENKFLGISQKSSQYQTRFLLPPFLLKNIRNYSRFHVICPSGCLYTAMFVPNVCTFKNLCIQVLYLRSSDVMLQSNKIILISDIPELYYSDWFYFVFNLPNLSLKILIRKQIYRKKKLQVENKVEPIRVIHFREICHQ